MSEGHIYGLIGQAMRKIGAVGKNSKNEQQKFMYRGIDAVMNALSPVMSELGLFIVPEVLEQTREERQGRNGGNLIYSILKIKYTMYAPDGSNVSCVVIGEGMDSGDKASNKAMSVAMKYAAFQLFMIPTEEMIDPDSETHEVAPKNAPAQAAKKAVPATVEQAAAIPPVSKSQTVPAPKETPKMTVNQFIKEELVTMGELFEEPDPDKMMKRFISMRKSLIDRGVIPDIKSKDQTLEQAQEMVSAIYANFNPSGEFVREGET